MVRLKLILTFILFITFSTNIISSEQEEKPIAWKKYIKACGKNNRNKTKNFSKFKGKKIVWRGLVVEARNDSALTGNRRWAAKILRIKMTPTDSWIADVRLRFPNTLKKKIRKYKKGDHVLFMGVIQYVGSAINDHIVEVAKIKRYQLKKRKKKK